DVDTAAVEIGIEAKACHVPGRHRFQPHGLPNARDLRVPDAPRPLDLFASRLFTGVSWIANRDDQIVTGPTGCERIGDVQREGIVAAPVASQGRAVDDGFGVPVHRAKVEQDASSVRRLRRVEGPVIPEPLLWRHPYARAAQLRFD